MARAVTESALMAALSFLFYVASSIPLLGAFFFFLCPVPITFVGVRHGTRRAALSCACATVLVTALAGGFTAGYLFLSAFGIFGVASGWMLTRKSSMGRSLMLATFAVTLLLIPMTILVGQSLGAEEPLVAGEAALFKFVDEQVAKINDPGLTAAMPQLKSTFSTMMKFPLVAFFFSAFFGLYLNHWVTYKVLERMGTAVPRPANPYYLRMPVWGACALMVLAIRFGQIGGANRTYEAAIVLNLMLLCYYTAWLAGIAAVARMISPKQELPISRYLMLLVPGFLFGSIPMLLGLFDSFQPAVKDAPAA